MLEVTSAQTISMASGWNFGRVFALFAVLVGILALGATIRLLIKRRKMLNEQPEAPDSRIIRIGAGNILFGILWSISGVLCTLISIVFLIGIIPLTRFIDLCYVFNGICFSISGFGHVRSGIVDRAEYDENEIRVLRKFGFKGAIQWRDLETVKYRKCFRIVELRGGKAIIRVSSRDPDTTRLLQFMTGYVSEENQKAIEALLHKAMNGKSI